MRIVEDDLRRAEVRELLERHALGMQENSPQGAVRFLRRERLQSVLHADALTESRFVPDLARYTARSTAGR